MYGGGSEPKNFRGEKGDGVGGGDIHNPGRQAQQESARGPYETSGDGFGNGFGNTSYRGGGDGSGVHSSTPPTASAYDSPDNMPALLRVMAAIHEEGR